MLFLTSDWGPALERTARAVAPAIAFTIACWDALQEFDREFTDWWLDRWCGVQPPAVPPATQPAAPVAAPAVVTHQQLPIACLTVIELRSLARQRFGGSVRPGGRGLCQSRRADLLALLEAE